MWHLISVQRRKSPASCQLLWDNFFGISRALFQTLTLLYYTVALRHRTEPPWSLSTITLSCATLAAGTDWRVAAQTVRVVFYDMNTKSPRSGWGMAYAPGTGPVGASTHDSIADPHRLKLFGVAVALNWHAVLQWRRRELAQESPTSRTLNLNLNLNPEVEGALSSSNTEGSRVP
ncbi:hypothetical protein BGZ61DRAFT_523990 [Ilyonectria robusta]|uniref:uncharacterized protein n=1 Tax=Ilyonectria robusta TaxID=1079257 RepID=UPI001E8D627E|nr:uncharacterized protein BGZ61DRAFT_523990 [Ilyonectria robusta]KAH8656412.1 hypothetical protein BGZ61DRAFT_523990 [Ilyonectria robusta]